MQLHLFAAMSIGSDSGRLTFFKERARSQERLELRATNSHQIMSQWLLFAKKIANRPKVTGSSNIWI